MTGVQTCALPIFIFLGFEGILVIFWIRGYFCHFLGFGSILVIFWIRGYFCHLLGFGGYVGHFLGFRRYFGHFLGSRYFCYFLGFWGILVILRFECILVIFKDFRILLVIFTLVAFW